MKKSSVLSFLLLSSLLGGCASSSLPLEFSPFEDYMEEKDTLSDFDNGVYYRIRDNHSTYLKDQFPGLNGIKSFSDLSSLYLNGNKRILNSEQEARLLVVPITFLDKDTSLLNDKKILIQNAFFGSDEMNKYLSVASFYNKSSYGHLKITGEVTDFITYPKNISEIDASKASSKDEIINYAIDYLISSGFDYSSYKTQNDKYIDAIYFVYDHPHSSKGTNDIYWAVSEHKTQPHGPLVNYAWSAFDFMQDESGDIFKTHKVRANTFIHETGHLLGLLDYYNTSSGKYYQPTGFMDMMDYNVGDHSSFSKYSLNWSHPFVLKNEGEISIRDFSSSGDFILIPSSSYNDNPYGEYLLIEYFTPSGLNNSTYFPNYSYTNAKNEEKIFSYPTRYGLRIYHVDARLGYFSFRQTDPFAFIDDSDEVIAVRYKSGNSYIDYYYNNSPSYDNEPVLVHLLEASGENTFASGNGASNETLFRPGMVFNKNVFENYTFHSGEKLKYTFEFSDFRSSNVTLKFKIK